jgi:hypothetical protein
MPNVEQHGYRVYPLVDHIADTVAAFFQRYGDGLRPSTRYRDLVDLAAIVTVVSVRADDQLQAMSSQFDRRGLVRPARFDVPDRPLWEAGYAREAERSARARWNARRSSRNREEVHRSGPQRHSGLILGSKPRSVWLSVT